MKKTVAVSITLVLLLLICACGNGKTTEKITNPMTEYSTLQELNNVCNVNLNTVSVPGVANEHYYCVDAGDTKIAEYAFTLDKTEFSLRAARNTTEDISGYYFNGKPLFDAVSVVLPGEGANFTGSDFKASRWFAGDTQYILLAKDNGKFDAGRFAVLATQLEDCTKN